MPIITDYIVIAAILYFFLTGWNKGFLKTILGPLSLVIGCMIGFVHYQKTQNLIASLGICILSPFVINILISLILKLWHKAVSMDKSIPLPSRLLGSLFSLFWGSSYLGLMLILIAVTPLPFSWYEKIQNDVLSSKSYSLINEQISKKFPNSFLDVKKITGVLKNPNKLKAYESTEEFKALSNDERLKELFSDEETAKQLRNPDYGKLLSNPKIQAIFQDKELLDKLFALNKKIAEDEVDESPGPKVIDIQPKLDPHGHARGPL